MNTWWLPVEGVLLRDLRKYRRCMGVTVATVFLPLLQLLVIGYAIGGRIHDVPVGLLSLDQGPAAWAVEENLRASQTAQGVFALKRITSLEDATRAIGNGRIAAAIVVPESYTRDLVLGREAKLAILSDNTDPITDAALQLELMAALPAAPGISVVNAPMAQSSTIRFVGADRFPEIVPLFPESDYFSYLAPGAIVLGILFACGIGGGMIYVDDRWNGLSAGYLSTPVTAWQMVMGMQIAGTLKSFATGVLVTLCALAITGIWKRVDLSTVVPLVLFLGLVSVTLTSIVNLISVRMKHPLMSRVVFAACVGALYMPSGAIYPISGFPEWLQMWSVCNPFTYAVHGMRLLLLKGSAWAGLHRDVVILCSMALMALLLCRTVYPRRLF